MEKRMKAVRLPVALLLLASMLLPFPLLSQAAGDTGTQTLKKEIPVKVEQSKKSGQIANTSFEYELKGLDTDSIEAMQTLPEDSLSKSSDSAKKADLYTFQISGWTTPGELPMSYDADDNKGVIHFTKAGEYRYELSHSQADQSNHKDVTNWADLPVYTIHVYIADDQKGGLKLKAVTASTDGADDKVSEITFEYTGKSGGSTPTPPPTPSPSTYTLTYVTFGGTEYPKAEYRSGADAAKDILANVPVKAGYLFEGWYEDEDLTNPITENEAGRLKNRLEDDDSYIMSKDRWIYAKWKEVALNKDDHYAYIIGYPDGTVQPQGKITRAEVATIFFRLLMDETRTSMWYTENDYSDVDKENWFNNAVSTLSNGSIVTGYPDGTFKPNHPITRAEFATIAARFDKSEPDVSDSRLTDIKNHWAEEYIKKAEALGYIEGYEDHSFKPNQDITRAEAMTLINRVLDRDTIQVHGLLEDDMVQWIDNMDQEKWYYVAVQEATNSHEYQKDPDEVWSGMRENRDWEALEKVDSKPDSSSNPGNVAKITSVFSSIGNAFKSLFGLAS